MRIKDEQKQEAIIKATVKLVNEIGFAASSVSKIAKEADVSPATLYIYYKNKEDLLISTYVNFKQKLSNKMLEGFNKELPIRDILKTFWFNAYQYIDKNSDFYHYTEQFSNSPYASLVDKAEVDKYFEPMIEVLQRGIKEKVIKDVHLEMLFVFIFFPLMTLTNPRLCGTINLTNTNIEKAFDLAWDAIKL